MAGVWLGVVLGSTIKGPQYGTYAAEGLKNYQCLMMLSCYQNYRPAFLLGVSYGHLFYKGL